MQRHTDFIKVITEEQQQYEPPDFEMLNEDIKSQNLASGLVIIRENMKNSKPEELIKPFVLTWEEAYSIELPRIRKANVRSNIKDLN